MKNLFTSNGLRLMMMALSLSILAAGCGGDSGSTDEGGEAPGVKEETAKVETPAPAEKEMPAEAAPAVEEAPAEAPAPAANATAVAGTVKLDGTPPVMQAIANINDVKCHAAHGDDPITSERVLCGKDGGLQNVFITITNPPAGDYPAPEAPVILDQVGCMYTPHVVGVQVNQTLEVRNSDPTMHNVHRIARANGQANRMQIQGSKPLNQIFTKSEDRMRFKCDVHPWMNAFVFVIEHPFFAVTDANGAFSIAGLPAGEYDVKAWHEHYKEQMGKVTVDANGAGTVSFTYTAETE